MRIISSNFDKPIYVLLYHPWLDGFETYFTAHLPWLKENGFESISLENLSRYLDGEEVPIPERPIVLTFDDGTIENYTVVYPLLKKYGYKGTVFVPTADHYVKKSGMDWWREVDSEGVLRIEGHSHTHALIFVDDRIQDFVTAKDRSLEPYIKGLDERPGAPIFTLGYELASRMFMPRRDFLECCVRHVERQGGVGFFEREGWKEEMLGLAAEYKMDRGRYETEEERGKRIKEEITFSKEMIEQAIGSGKEVRFFAYPFGAYDLALVECLRTTGYIGAFTTLPGENLRGENPYLVKRMMILAEDSFGGLERILSEYR